MIEELNKIKAQAVGEDPNSIWRRVDARILDAMDLNSIPDGSISHVTASWVSLVISIYVSRFIVR